MFNKRIAVACFSLIPLLLVSIKISKCDETLISKSTSEPSLESSQSITCDKDSKTASIMLVGVLSSLVFSFIGILPAFFIRTDQDEERFKNSTLFKLLLAFAAGNLLADIFLHLMPEASTGGAVGQSNNGLYIIIAFLLFLTIEKVTELVPDAHALGALNLLANFFDNSAHGTTVVGGFQVSITFGLIALLATIVHEVPHEFSDFALLLRDGYSRKKAIFLQLITAFAGTIGATIAYAMTTHDSCLKTNENMYLRDANEGNYSHGQDLNSYGHHHHHHHHHHHEHSSHHSSFILPFTIGGFLYISLVGIIPEIINEKSTKVSFLQMISLVCGVFFIYVLIQIENVLPEYFA